MCASSHGKGCTCHTSLEEAHDPCKAAKAYHWCVKDERHWLLCLEWGACALAEWGVNVRAWAA
jgi:hypothetical protein